MEGGYLISVLNPRIVVVGTVLNSAAMYNSTLAGSSTPV